MKWHDGLAAAERNIATSVRAMRLAIVIGAIVTVTGMAITVAHAQETVSVFVPGDTNGDFGNPTDEVKAMVSALTVTGPGKITVTYVSGTVTDSGGVNTGPKGVKFDIGGDQTPLQEAEGIAGGIVNNLDALIGVFVPASQANRSGFTPIDATKGTTVAGITPCHLFFIGTAKTFSVSGAGTLYLGVNDALVGDNGGGFNVTVSFQ